MVRLLLATLFFFFVAVVMITIVRGPVVRPSTSDDPAAETASGTARLREERTRPTPTTGGAAAGGVSRLSSARAGSPDFGTLSAAELPDLRSTYVLADATPVYSSNSASADVLGVLRAGYAIEPGVRVLDSDGLWWIEVLLDERPAGFVRSDDLGPQ